MRLGSLHIEQFRGIENLSLEDFRDVNLLLGGNDIGKTSILEAIMLFSGPNDLSTILRSSRMRLSGRSLAAREAYSSFESFLHFFPFSDATEKRFSVGAHIEGSWYTLCVRGELVRLFRPPFSRVTGRQENGDEREITAFEGVIDFNGSIQEIEVPEDITYRIPGKRSPSGIIEYIAPGQHLNGISNRSVFRHKAWEQETVELLRIIDPDIEGIKLVPSEYSGMANNQVLEHRSYGEIPLYTFGDGMKKILSLASVLPSARGGILMIDEIETSLQASNLSKIFRWLLDASRWYDIQLFVTTHSLEAISVLSDCASDHASELACFRLEKYNGHSTARRYSERRLDEMVNGSGLDVR